LKTVADPIGRTTTTDVLETGQIKTLTDTTGKNTGCASALGDLVTVTDPLGRATRLTSDTISQLVAARDPAGSISRSTYDKQGRTLSTMDPLGRSTSYTYDANGNLKTVTDPRSKTTTYTYDLMSRVKTVTDPLNRGTTYDYDLADRLKTVTDSAAGVTTFTLNDRDQLTKSVTLPNCDDRDCCTRSSSESVTGWFCSAGPPRPRTWSCWYCGTKSPCCAGPHPARGWTELTVLYSPPWCTDSPDCCASTVW